MNEWSATASTDPLLRELRWFVRLRWVTGAAVLVAMAINAGWFGGVAAEHLRIVAVGAFILAYNAVLYAVLRRPAERSPDRRWLVVVAIVQIVLDLACLAALNAWTGGFQSPLIGLFVLHMVFASLLLPRAMSFGVAAVAIALMAIGAWCTDQWPVGREETLLSAGWIVTLLLTVFVTNHVTSGLRERDERLRRQQQVLMQSEKMSAMGQMAAGVTHELSNPLASMDSLLQLLKRRPNRMTGENIDVLRGQIDRMNKIIRMMRTFAHPGETEAEPAELNAAVGHGVDMAGFDRRLKSVEVGRSFDPDCGRMRLVPQTIEQVVVNLVLNAADAVEGRPDPRVEVATERRDGACVIRVADNGQGIADADIERIFDPFFTTKPVGRGTGLGLAICYRLVEQHGGTIEVASMPGLGTTFRVVLPTVEEGS